MQGKGVFVRVNKWLEILVPSCIIAGALSMAADAQALQSMRSASPMVLVGAVLLLTGATAGLMNYVITRRSSRLIATEAVQTMTGGKARFLDVPEGALGPLVVV